MNAYISPAKTRPEHILPADLKAARAVLKFGGSLTDASVAIGSTTAALDIALWRSMGGQAR